MELKQAARYVLPWLLFAEVGWEYPRYLIATETTIVTKKPPYQVTAAGDVILDFNLNEKVIDPPTISSELLTFITARLPIIVTVAHTFFQSRTMKTNLVLELTTVICAISMAVGLCEGSVQLLKLWIQRKRPSYYDLCGFDVETRTCTAPLGKIREANFSFPSGHSAGTCCGMTFIAWYFLGKLKGRHQKWLAPLIAIGCWGFAIFVAATRLVEKWHHPADILAGLLLGFATCTVAYHSWYPPIWSPSAGVSKLHLEEADGLLKLPSSHE